MPAKEQEKPQAGPVTSAGPAAGAAIGRQVLAALGRPEDLQSVQVRHLWADHYRVNIFVGDGAASARVAHSYFLVADDAGKVVASTPLITKIY